MEKILKTIEKDKLAGVYVRDDGRISFNPRKVEFETIEFKPEYIFSHKWSIFQNPLEPIHWEQPIEELERELINFSIECSKRFHHIWYYYIDVMLARSLSTNDKNIFQKDFIIPSIFLDLGIPENEEWTNVPINIHRKIVHEYNLTKDYNKKYKIFYLSYYLKDITKDINEFLMPYRTLWDKEKKKLELYEAIKQYIQDFYNNQFFSFIKQMLNTFIIEKLLSMKITFENKFVVSLYYKIRENPAYDLSYYERKILLEYLFEENQLSEELKILFILNQYTIFPQELERFIRKILFIENRILKTKIQQYRILYNKFKNNLDFVDFNGDDFINLKDNRSDKYIEDKINCIYQLTEFFNLQHNLYLNQLFKEYEKQNILTIPDFINFFKNIKPEEIKNEIKDILLKVITDISKINYQILEFYKNSFTLKESIFKEDHKYMTKVIIPENFIPGNPFQEKEMLDFFKNILKQRLKPIRMAANDYSLIYKEKHGILTLNPVLKLWKNKIQFNPKLPEIIQLELNTPITVECLIELIKLVDKEITTRELRRGQILKQIKGKESLETMIILLLPGSCYPIKEIPASHFPEFYNKIIGEKRSISEVGVKETHYILTGAWYNKNNHTLYYPIGGDNAELLNKIYFGIRTNIIPAFFFAIGQFVFECLPDNILYFKNTKLTFREILMKIYKNKISHNQHPKKIKLLSKEEIKFQFAIHYSLLIMENLTGGLHIHHKIPEMYKWFLENLNIQSIFSSNKEIRKKIRIQAQDIIEEYNKKLKELGYFSKF